MAKWDEQQLLCFTDQDSQKTLSVALQHKNLTQFQRALSDGGANPEQIDPETFISIFEKCLQLPGHADFITACIRWGCDINKVNKHTNKAPINFAIESEDANNIAALLQNPSQKIDINHLYEDLTPIHRLATNLNDSNHNNIFNCIKELIDHQADVNIPNRRSMTPILTIAKKSIENDIKLKIVKYFLENSNVDLDTYRNSEARTYLEKNFSELNLPPKLSEDEQSWDFHKLYMALDNGEELKFIYGLDAILKDLDNEDNRKNLFREMYANETLLLLAARKGFVRPVEKLLRCGADVNNYRTEKTNSGAFTTRSPVEIACIYGNWAVLQLLLKCPDIDLTDSPLLVTIVKNIGENSNSETCNYEKCFNILLKSDKTDVNEKDLYGSTPLHFAVKYNNESAILKILEEGAYLGAKNKLNDYPIADIDPRILEKHFDQCISPNDRRSGDDNFEIKFDYKNLIPIDSRQKNDESLKKSTIVKRHTDEMGPIEYIARSSELKHLVQHPLIASFLFLKWFRLATIFYFNFLCYSTYCIAIIFYLIFCYGQDTSKELAAILYTITVLGALYIFIREMIQMIMSPMVYVKNLENYLELLLILMTIIVLFGQDFSENARRTIAAFTILIVISEFFLLTGSLPILSFSTHLVMLKTVSKSFLKSLLLYSIILLAFALCFYTLFSEDGFVKEETETKSSVLPTTETTSKSEEDDETEFNNFLHPGISIIKTVVMLTGEFDASSINFKHNVWSYVIFLIFVFLISTVLFNLLNGLAVSDTQAIKNEAELMHFIHRAQIMGRYEKILLGHGESVCCNFIFRNWCTNIMSVFPDFLPLHILKVLPNANNQVIIPIPIDGSQKNNGGIGNAEEGNTFYKELNEAARTPGCWGRCSRMESKIVKYAKRVLENKQIELTRREKEKDTEERLVKIEKCIDQIMLKIDLVSNKIGTL